MTTDADLLALFARTNSETAFAELVQRHVNLVYSAARRQVNGDDHLAKDVAQLVFTDLARKADSLSRRESLTGWLYTSAHLAAAKIVRGENRRRDREEKFMREPIDENAPAADWEKLRPMLDAAMHELKKADREAVLLRYFENRPFAEVGVKLGLNENAARMRVERALEKLRGIFAKRGVAATASLAAVISANAVQTAPVGLAATLTTASIAGVGTGTFALLKMLTMTKIKFVGGALAVTGAVLAFVLLHQSQEKLRVENAALAQQLAQLQTDNENLSNRLAAIGNSKSQTDEQLNELLKLRAQVTQLYHMQIASKPAILTDTNGQSAIEPIQVHIKANFISFPNDALPSVDATWTQNEQGGRTGIMTAQQFKTFNQARVGAMDLNNLGMPEATTSNGRETKIFVGASVPTTNAVGEVTNLEAGIAVDVLPFYSTNTSNFDLDATASISWLTGSSPQAPDDLSHLGMENKQAKARMTLSAGQTIILQIPTEGWPLESSNLPGPRTVLVFLTPKTVNSRGEATGSSLPNQ